MSGKAVYLDYNATTPLHRAAAEAMAPFWADDFGNASSRHSFGRGAHDAVAAARQQVAAAVGARADEVIFTASGTESNNTIIKGVALMSLRRIVAAGATEHPCVICSARTVGRGGGTFVPLAVDRAGRLDVDDLDAVLAGGEVALVSVMLANNETGVLNDVAAIAQKVKAAGAVMHTDAAQAVGKIPVNFAALGVDAMTLSAHKANGPKGAAALLVRRDVDWAPLLDGGGHEEGRRSSTENVPAIVGMGAAFAMAKSSDTKRLQTLRDEMEKALQAAGATIFGGEAARLPNTSLFGFPGIDGESMVVMLDQSGFAVASGAACSSMKDEPSHVLLAMETPTEVARTAVRVSLGAATGADDVEQFAAAAVSLSRRLQAMSSLVND